MSEWTRNPATLDDAIQRESDAMLGCRTLSEHGCTEWDGACELCTLRIDYLSALRALLRIAEQEADP